MIFRLVKEKAINRGNCLKRGAWTVCRFKGVGGEGGGGLTKKRGGIFERKGEG